MQNDPRLWYERLLDLIDLLYQAKTPNAISDQLFQGLVGLVPYDAAIYTPINWQTLELQEGYCYGNCIASMVSSQCSHAPFDPLFFDPLCLTRLNKTIRLSDIVPVNSLALHEFNIFYQNMPYQHALGVIVSWRQQPIAAIRLYRRACEPNFSDSEMALLNRLSLHVANAVHFQDSTLALTPLRENGLIVFGANEGIIYKNEAVAKMLTGIPLTSVLSLVKKGDMWLKNGAELYRAETVPLTSASLLKLFAKTEADESTTWQMEAINDLNNKSHPVTIVSIEPFRRRQAIGNRLKYCGLSPREIEVSLGIMRGLSNSNIAKQLFIDEKTVKDHLQRIYAKIHIKTRTELISKMLGLDIELGCHENGNDTGYQHKNMP
ncbi:MAG: helix-turn-helix transcriptional regulator [Methylococcaceae bacterium]|nr:helix-turn-helix transcriptional regulator [Methylococcaceae bacterium]